MLFMLLEFSKFDLFFTLIRGFRIIDIPDFGLFLKSHLMMVNIRLEFDHIMDIAADIDFPMIFGIGQVVDVEFGLTSKGIALIGHI